MRQVHPEERKVILNLLWQAYVTECHEDQDKAKKLMRQITGKPSSKDFTDDDLWALADEMKRRQIRRIQNEKQRT